MGRWNVATFDEPTAADYPKSNLPPGALAPPHDPSISMHAPASLPSRSRRHIEIVSAAKVVLRSLSP